MTRPADLLITALAPAVWGSTYLVTTEFLPEGYPITLAVLRALPAGLLLLAITRRFPPRAWIGRVFLLGVLNFAAFWTLLFVAAQRLPGGVAATVISLQALLAIGMAWGWLGTPVRPVSVVAALAGVGGVGLLLLGPGAALDPLGLAAALGAAAAMAAGTVLSRKWRPPVSALSFTAWQLTAGGLALLPLAFFAEPKPPALDMVHLGGLLWLGLVGAAATYWIWFRGVERIEPAAVSMLGMMSPVTAVALGWIWLGQSMTPIQGVGAAVALGAVWVSQAAYQTPRRLASSEPPPPRSCRLTPRRWGVS
ncbi:MAG: EamA family transporter [Marivibrio sp.]|uniref:EamA family transporter n=1 Tax=Marivibrio sp. TaxID=2039719 RepID=UPI0032EDDE28